MEPGAVRMPRDIAPGAAAPASDRLTKQNMSEKTQGRPMTGADRMAMGAAAGAASPASLRAPRRAAMAERSK